MYWQKTSLPEVTKVLLARKVTINDNKWKCVRGMGTMFLVVYRKCSSKPPVSNSPLPIKPLD